MATRAYTYGESLSRETSSTTDYSFVKAAITFTPDASSTYVLIWSVLLDHSTNNQAYARLQNTTAATTLAETFHGTPSTTVATSKHFFGGIAIYTSGGSPSSTTFQVQCKATAGGTVGAQESTLIAIKLETGDQFNSAASETSSTSTTYASKVGLSWTPASAGDYLVIASAERRPASGEGRTRLNISGSAASTADKNNYWFSTDQASYCAMARMVNVSGAQTADLEFSSSSASAAYIRNANIVALRLSNFDARFWAEDRTLNSSTSGTYAASASVVGTPAAVAHLILAAGISSTNAASANDGTGLKISAGGGDIGTNFFSGCGYSGYWWSWMQFRVRTESAATTTWQTQYARTVGTATAQSDEHVIAVLQLVASSSETTIAATSVTAMAAYGRMLLIMPIGIP